MLDRLTLRAVLERLALSPNHTDLLRVAADAVEDYGAPVQPLPRRRSRWGWPVPPPLVPLLPAELRARADRVEAELAYLRSVPGLLEELVRMGEVWDPERLLTEMGRGTRVTPVERSDRAEAMLWLGYTDPPPAPDFRVSLLVRVPRGRPLGSGAWAGAASYLRKRGLIPVYGPIPAPILIRRKSSQSHWNRPHQGAVFIRVRPVTPDDCPAPGSTYEVG